MVKKCPSRAPDRSAFLQGAMSSYPECAGVCGQTRGKMDSIRPPPPNPILMLHAVYLRIMQSSHQQEFIRPTMSLQGHFKSRWPQTFPGSCCFPLTFIPPWNMEREC